MKRLGRGLVLTAAAAFSAHAAHAQDIGLAPLPIDTFRLSNGLRVAISEDHSSPVVAVSLWVHGGRAAEPENGALAQLVGGAVAIESASFGAGEAARRIQDAGGASDFTSDLDRIAFMELVPEEALRLALEVQADRLREPPLSDEVWRARINTLRAEVMRLSAQPYALAQLTADTLATRSVRYRMALDWTTQAAKSDSWTAEVARAYHRRWFTPANVTLAVVGDVERDEVRSLVRELFGGIQRREVPATVETPAAPDSAGPARTVLVEGPGPSHLLWVAYAVPDTRYEDLEALSVLSSVLSGGESSRLYRRLVDEQRLAESVVSVLNLRRGPGTLVFGISLASDVDPDLAEALTLSILEEVSAEGVAEAQIRRAVNRRTAALVTERLSVSGKAELLQRHWLFAGSPFAANEELSRVRGVDELDLVRVSAAVLIPAGRAVVRVDPAGGGR